MSLRIGLLSTSENKNIQCTSEFVDARCGAERPLADVSCNLINRTHSTSGSFDYGR
jgi:hypothetical protein